MATASHEELFTSYKLANAGVASSNPVAEVSKQKKRALLQIAQVKELGDDATILAEFGVMREELTVALRRAEMAERRAEEAESAHAALQAVSVTLPDAATFSRAAPEWAGDSGPPVAAGAAVLDTMVPIAHLYAVEAERDELKSQLAKSEAYNGRAEKLIHRAVAEQCPAAVVGGHVQAELDHVQSRCARLEVECGALRKRDEDQEVHIRRQSRNIQEKDTQIQSFEDQLVKLQRQALSWAASFEGQLHESFQDKSASSSLQATPSTKLRFVASSASTPTLKTRSVAADCDSSSRQPTNIAMNSFGKITSSASSPSKVNRTKESLTNGLTEAVALIEQVALLSAEVAAALPPDAPSDSLPDGLAMAREVMREALIAGGGADSDYIKSVIALSAGSTTVPTSPTTSARSTLVSNNVTRYGGIGFTSGGSSASSSRQSSIKQPKPQPPRSPHMAATCRLVDVAARAALGSTGGYRNSGSKEVGGARISPSSSPMGSRRASPHDSNRSGAPGRDSLQSKLAAGTNKATAGGAGAAPRPILRGGNGGALEVAAAVAATAGGSSEVVAAASAAPASNGHMRTSSGSTSAKNLPIRRSPSSPGLPSRMLPVASAQSREHQIRERRFP